MSIQTKLFKSGKVRVSLALMITSLFILISGCSPEKNDHLTLSDAGINASIPTLLTRNTHLGSSEEQLYYAEAFQTLKEAITKNPEDYRNRLKLAQLFMLEARITGEHGYYYPAALKVLDDILAEKPADDVVFGATSLKASVFLSLHKFKEAKKLAEYAVSLNGFNSVIYGSLVDANVELGNYQEAVAMADKMMEIRPDLRSYSRVSYLREIHGDLDGAIEAMKMATKAGYPGYEETAWSRLMLGNLYQKKGELENAATEYKRILQERPDYPFAIAALAEIDHEKGDYQSAENRLKQAIEVIPEVSFYVDLAKLYGELGNEEAKGKLVPEILEMLADDEANGHLMGLEYAEVYLDLANDPQKALASAQKEYNRRPENIEVNEMMARIYYQMEELDKAEMHIQKAERTKYADPDLAELVALIKAERKS